MKQALVVLSFLLLNTFGFAQSSGNGIVGVVKSQENQPLSFANIILHNLKDTGIAKVEVTDEAGAFKIFPVVPGDYFLEITYVGSKPYRSKDFSFTGNTMDMGTITLESLSKELEEIVVTAKRPMLEVKPDKTVFNIEGSINASGGNAMELLKKSPGVVVDNDDNIMLLGKSGVKIYIDGKKSPFSASDLANMLKNIPSEQIDAIEIITNPSARYEAEGNAGIINIRLKKNENTGTNGSVRAGFSYGKFAKYNSSLTLNHRNTKLNVFGSLSGNIGKWHNSTNFYREINGIVFDQKNVMISDGKGGFLKAGVDFFLNDNNTIGLLFNGSYNPDEWNSDGRTRISNLTTNDITGHLIATNDIESSRINNNYNFNYQFKNKKSTTLNIDFDYGTFRNTDKSFQPNRYYNPDMTVLEKENISSSETPTEIDIYTAKLDFVKSVFGGKIETGIKLAKVITDNTFDFYHVTNNVRELDSTRSNRFVYNEYVNAGYLSFSRPINKTISVSAGLRVEQTNSKGELTSFFQNEKPVERTYIDWFPTAGISWQVNQKNNLRLNYGKRINRPNYQELNPFEAQIDELTYQKGNPFLQPQYSHNIKLGYTYNYFLNIALNYTHIDDYVARLIDTTNQTASFITWKNLASQKVYSFSVSAPVTITGWWSTFTNISGYQQRNRADFGGDRKINLEVFGGTIYNQNTFTLPKDISIELSGFYASPSVWGGTFKTTAMWAMDIGIQKKIFNKKGNIKIALSDIFNSQRWGGTSNYNGQVMTASGQWESQRIKVNFSYNFGNNKIKSRKRKTGLEEEESRIKTDRS